MTSEPAITVAAHSERGIEGDSVLALYRAQGWWPDRTAGQIAAVLASGPAVGAWRGDELVGFARAVTDRFLRAYIEDVIVAPELRHAGVGQAVMDRLMRELASLPVVTLFCEADLVRFYELSGFHATSQVVMHRNARPLWPRTSHETT
jgi:ribosomal protein S18 acetylase RimI-like enzyme